VPVGNFLSYNQPDPSYALAHAAVSDEKVWGMMQRGELGPVSVVLHCYRASCSKCGATLSFDEGPEEHQCIKSGSGHEQLDSFVFHRVDFIDVPAYPQAGLLEFSAKAVDHAVPIEVLASFYVSQSSKESKKLSEKLEEKVAALEQANKQLESDLKKAQKDAEDAGRKVTDLNANWKPSPKKSMTV
jgi:outer membrane murein-binding lipoprotein Lpp